MEHIDYVTEMGVVGGSKYSHTNNTGEKRTKKCSGGLCVVYGQCVPLVVLASSLVQGFPRELE